MIEMYKGYEIEVYEGKTIDGDMIHWSIKRSDGIEMTSDSEYGNYNTIVSVVGDLKNRIDKWFNLLINKKK